MTFPDYILKSRERFRQETAEHEMTVLHDDGLYRHLRCQQPGTSIYYFDVVTWPGVLTINGDCGTFVFSRVRDMFEFFEGYAWGINPHYWAQKLQAPRSDRARVFSVDAYRTRVLEWFADVADEMEPDEARSLRAALEERVLVDEDYGCPPHDESDAYRLLSTFEHEGTRIYDPSDWDIREYDWQFLWCCWAIVWAIREWRTAERRVAA